MLAAVSTMTVNRPPFVLAWTRKAIAGNAGDRQRGRKIDEKKILASVCPVCSPEWMWRLAKKEPVNGTHGATGASQSLSVRPAYRHG
jgi:hypothetical protein